MIPEPELGEGGEELAAPDTVVLLLIIQRDEDVVTDAESLQLGSGQSLSCDGDAEVFADEEKKSPANFGGMSSLFPNRRCGLVHSSFQIAWRSLNEKHQCSSFSKHQSSLICIIKESSPKN